MGGRSSNELYLRPTLWAIWICCWAFLLKACAAQGCGVNEHFNDTLKVCECNEDNFPVKGGGCCRPNSFIKSDGTCDCMNGFKWEESIKACLPSGVCGINQHWNMDLGRCECDPDNVPVRGGCCKPDSFVNGTECACRDGFTWDDRQQFCRSNLRHRHGGNATGIAIGVTIAVIALMGLFLGALFLLPRWRHGLHRRRERVTEDEPALDPSIQLGRLRSYSYDEVFAGSQDFNQPIGSGASADVYRALLDGKEVAVKKLKGDANGKEFQREAEQLNRFHSVFLVDLLGFSADPGKPRMLIYEYMPGGSLSSFLYSSHEVSISFRCRIGIALDVARGIEYCHHGVSNPIVHRDIKPGNILLDKHLNAKVADFGLARMVKVDPTTQLPWVRVTWTPSTSRREGQRLKVTCTDPGCGPTNNAGGCQTSRAIEPPQLVNISFLFWMDMG